MAKLNKKLAMMGVSIILIPLGRLVLKKIVREIINKLDSKSSDDKGDKLVSIA